MEASSQASLEISVSEIHGYPLRPKGYAEPLFHDGKSRKEILEHLARSSWLGRASEASRPRRKATGVAAGRTLARWREVDRWWEPGGGVDVVWSLVELDRGGERVLADPPRNEESHEVRTLRTAA